MTHIRIRPVTLQDASDVWKMLCILENKSFDFALFVPLLEQNLQQEGYIYLLAVDGQGQALGYISCHGQLLLHHMNMVYEIQELVVVPEARGLGVGKQLVAAVEQILTQRPHDVLEVASNKRRTEAHRFYESCGFTGSHFKFTKKSVSNAPTDGIPKPV